MGIYDDPRAGVTNSLMGQRQQARPFDAGFNNGNSLYAGGAPQQGLFGGMSTANSLQSGGMPASPAAPSGGMGMAGGGIVPQQPQMDITSYTNPSGAPPRPVDFGVKPPSPGTGYTGYGQQWSPVPPPLAPSANDPAPVYGNQQTPPQGTPMAGIFGQGSPYSGIFGNTPGVQRSMSLGGGGQRWGASTLYPQEST